MDPSPRSRLLQWGTLGYGLGRGAHFLAQLRALQILTRPWVPGGFPTRSRDPQVEDRLFQELFLLLKRESMEFASGRFPLSLLRPENPLRHGLRAGALLWDGWRLLRQKKSGRTAVFSEQAKEFAFEKPRYYQRNFHFQEDGYLSDSSAALYEHQVEVLFAGMADSMRRMVLVPLLDRWGPTQGEGLRILEVGAGTGRVSRMIHQVLPKARLTVSDLSEVYLQRARKKLEGVSKVEFIQAAAEELPLQAGRFDAVVSVFLFHELPLEVRKKVLLEKVRVARAGGLIAAVDSLQRHDIPEVASILEQFPRDFHEPYYRNYIENPLEALFNEVGIQAVHHQTGFVSKCVSGLTFAS